MAKNNINWWLIIGVAVIVSVVASVITANITGNVISQNIVQANSCDADSVCEVNGLVASSGAIIADLKSNIIPGSKICADSSGRLFKCPGIDKESCSQLLTILKSAWGTNCSSNEYNKFADIDNDGKIDFGDFSYLSPKIGANDQVWCESQFNITENPCFSNVKKYHSADINKDWKIDATEFSTVLAYWRAKKYHCELNSNDGYAPGIGFHNCPYHSADYNKDWKIDNSEKLRVKAYWTTGGYVVNSTGFDGFAPCSACSNGCSNGACN